MLLMRRPSKPLLRTPPLPLRWDSPAMLWFLSCQASPTIWSTPTPITCQAGHHLGSRDEHCRPSPPATSPSRPWVLTPFYEACALLWLASQPAFSFGILLEILHVCAPVTWAKCVGAANILSATSGSGPGLSTTTQATKNLTEVCGLLRDSIMRGPTNDPPPRTSRVSRSSQRKLIP
jgi:hypothetical protein